MSRFFRSALFPLILIVAGCVSRRPSSSRARVARRHAKLNYSQLISDTEGERGRAGQLQPQLAPDLLQAQRTASVSGTVSYPSDQSGAQYELVLQAHHVDYGSKKTGSNPIWSILAHAAALRASSSGSGSS